MKEVGLDIRELTRHLAECPPSFLDEPVQPSGFGGVHVAAVVSDLMIALGGGRLSQEEANRFRYTNRSTVRQERNRLRLALLAAWVYSHKALRKEAGVTQIKALLTQNLEELAGLLAADDLVHDSERREEFVRVCLSAVDLRPSGESKAEAENRLAALSTVERERVIAEARVAEERARKVREKMLEEERARRAASVYQHD